MKNDIADQIVNQASSPADSTDTETPQEPSEAQALLDQILDKKQLLVDLRDSGDGPGVVSARGEAQAAIGQLTMRYNAEVLKTTIVIACPGAASGQLKRLQGLLRDITGVSTAIQSASALYQFLAEKIEAGFNVNGRITPDMFDEIYSRLSALVPVLGMRPVIPSTEIINRKCSSLDEVRTAIREAIDPGVVLGQPFNPGGMAAAQPAGYVYCRGEALQALLAAEVADESIILLHGDAVDVRAFAPALSGGRMIEVAELPSRSKLNQEFAENLCQKIKQQIRHQ